MRRQHARLWMPLTVVVAAAVVAVLIVGPVTAGAASTKTIAEVTTHDFRLSLDARQASGSPPTATVTISLFERSGSGWKRVATRPVGRAGEWFWNVVSGRAAVCKLSVDASRPAPAPGVSVATSLPRHVSVRLLRSASLGCSGAFQYQLVDGTLVPSPLPRNAQAYANALFRAWRSGDASMERVLATPSAFETLRAHRSSADARWTSAGCEGAAGSVYCTWNGAPGRLVFRVGNELAAHAAPHAVREVRFSAP